MRRKQVRYPIGPLDEADTVRERLVNTEFKSVIAGRDPVEIEMPDRGWHHLVDLHKGKGRARNLPLDATGTQEISREGGFAGTEIARQCDNVTTMCLSRDLCGETLRRADIWKQSFDRYTSGRARVDMPVCIPCADIAATKCATLKWLPADLNQTNGERVDG